MILTNVIKISKIEFHLEKGDIMPESEKMTLSKYVLSNFVKYFDLSKERFDFLIEILAMYNADEISVQEFKENYLLDNQDYFGILTYILDTTNLAKLSKNTKNLSIR